MTCELLPINNITLVTSLKAIVYDSYS
uniref:Uncharacterized protein n=1 Tax=Anguilla anguilla TaxID=7936 RepID=A0A0E9SBP1_ANGAN